MDAWKKIEAKDKPEIEQGENVSSSENPGENGSASSKKTSQSTDDDIPTP